jgi:multidrug efflux pump subunit AcrA (membrane-fusion protein)
MSDDPTPESQGIPGPAKRHRRTVPSILGAVAVSVGLFQLAREFSRPVATSVAAGPVATIQVAHASKGDIGVYVEALGTVTPLSTVNIYSQVTGVVTAVHYTEGQTIERGQPLIDVDTRPYEAQLQEAQGTLEHDRALLTQAQIDLERYREASVNQAMLSVEAMDRTQQKLLGEGQLLAFDNQVDTTTGTVRFRAEFANRDMTLFPNQFVNARLLVKTLKGVVLVPAAAVQHNGTEAFVYVQNGDLVKSRLVKEIGTEGNSSAVEGLAAGVSVRFS